MAGTSLLVLLDDIAAVLDDVATMTKVAARKTAGVLGDDLAVNAEKVTGVRADRELPVVWAVAKGSFRNKVILVPAALLVSVIAPWLIKPALIAGGLFLCFEGFEKLAHPLLHPGDTHGENHVATLTDESIDLVAFEQEKIKGAVRTDFILSAEIIVLTLGIVSGMDLLARVLVLAGIAVIMTVGVYGLVAGIVKLDDAGFYLSQRAGESGWVKFQQWLGLRLLAFAPWLMKALGVVGTIAMFMVGGGILRHGFHAIEETVHGFADRLAELAAVGPALAAVTPILADVVVGMIAGAAVLVAVTLVQKARGAAAG